MKGNDIMSEFTKGEWEIMPYTRRDGDNIRWVKAIKGKKHIAICQTFKPNAEANARLIASAPGLKQQRDYLLTACERAKRFIRNGIELGYIKMPDIETDPAHETLPIIKAAIKKAQS